ncbi:hypothetical protein SAICODRAFT_29972 [Saitoella complicata NRRL Y-17804]|nr:uncharacterized protein SAICODRAFT_29972 [Saitoella complicata NRRL Y-17804]ODQ53572.1 hypothetical protein SAICODRAFT_29972 [Saitoella complicata NRRL Y-17804]
MAGPPIDKSKVPDLSIRPYTYRDLPIVRSVVADGFKNQSSLANAYIIYNFYFISTYIAALSAAYYALHKSTYASTSDWGMLLLTALSISVGFLIVVEYSTAPFFKGLKEEFCELPETDVFGVKKSGFWVAQYGTDIIGSIAVYPTKKPEVAEIRYWNVIRKYRSKHLGRDLLRQAIIHAGDVLKAKKVRVSTYTISEAAEKALRREGFEVVVTGAKVGGWLMHAYHMRERVWEVDVNDWAKVKLMEEKRRDEKREA